jgi:hypothetical protein
MRAAAAIVVMAALAGCGGEDRPAAPQRAASSTVAPLTGCPATGSGWRALPAGGGIDAARLGSGRVGVVFLNESGGSACGWVSFARELADRGYATAVLDGAGDASRGLATAAALRDAGARRVVLVGASVGGRAVLQAAARRPAGVAGVVSLSGERHVGAGPDLLPTARRVRLPVLFVGSREDGWTYFARDTRQLHAAVPARVNSLLLVSGGDHGVDLLADAHAARVRGAIETFLSARSSPGPS